MAQPLKSMTPRAELVAHFPVLNVDWICWWLNATNPDKNFLLEL